MKRKGFTLIELLAVIIILAIIAVIAVPTIMNIITKARRNAFKDSVYGIIKAGELYYSEKILNQEPIESDYEFIFPNDIKDLKFKGTKPNRGNMIVSKNGDIAVALSDGKYCVRKGYQENDVIIDEDINTCKTKEQANIILINDIKIEEPEVKISPLETKKLNILIEPSNATYKELEYTSSDTSVATINNGIVTGISNGSAVITIKTTDGTNIEKSMNVTVRTLVNDITLDKANITLVPNETSFIKATITPEVATNQNLEWKSNNENIVTVNNGEITAISNGTTTVTVKSTDDSNISKKITVNVKDVYKDSELNGTDPVLGSDLIPVTIENDGTVKRISIAEEWYNYNNKKWANAIILKSGSNYTIGDVIPEDNIESYFVWVPKYSYQLFDLGQYTTYIEEKPTTSNAKTINIKFGLNNTNDSNVNECTTPMTSGASGNCVVGDYMTHPAFVSMNTNGLWVGKFETTGTVDDISVKPNITSLRKQLISTMFNLAYNYKRTSDSHMMKNTEWGAITYLSHSKYGINKEININNNRLFLTGYSAVEGTEQSKFPGISGTDKSVTLPYNTSTGYKASSTGNISGIYDLSGGAWEYTSGYMDGQIGESGFTEENIKNYNSKYFDVYSSSSIMTRYYYRILGDATGEIGPFYYYKDDDDVTRLHNAWYTDRSDFVASNAPWFIRGNAYYGGILASQFEFVRHTGNAYSDGSFRLVLSIN